MSSYAHLLEGMMDAILTGDTQSANELYRDKDGMSAPEQLAVYTRGYRHRLHKIIRNTYPVLHYYLGKEPFQRLANDFIVATPSRYFNIDKYAIAFGEYVANTSEDVFACELAFLESMLQEIYHDPETPALEPSWLEQQTPDSLTNTHFQMRTASSLFRFSYPVSDYITAFHDDEKPAKPVETLTYLIVLRDQGHMQRVSLEEAEYTLLALIDEGHTLGAALASEQFAPFALDKQLAANFQHWFARWVSEGFFRMPN